MKKINTEKMYVGNAGRKLTVRNTTYIEQKNNQIGHIIYGPYIDLQKGLYMVRVHFHNKLMDVQNKNHLGRFEVVCAPEGNTRLATFEINSCQLIDKDYIDFTFPIHTDVSGVEFRIEGYYGANIIVNMNINLYLIAEDIIKGLLKNHHDKAVLLDNFNIVSTFLQFYNCKFLDSEKIIMQFKLVDFSSFNVMINSFTDLFVLYEIICKESYKFSINKKFIIFDIGMNTGIASLYFASMPNCCGVYAFEPFKKTYDAALENFKLNGNIIKKIHHFNFGLSNVNKIVNAEYNEQDTIGLSVRESETSASEQVVLKDVSKTLGHLINENYSSDKNIKFILKIDCEGSEFDIFDSLNKNFLLDKFSIIVGEWHKWWSADKDFSYIKNILFKNNFVIKEESYAIYSPVSCPFIAIQSK